MSIVPVTAPGAEPLARPSPQPPPLGRRGALALLGAILVAALALRLWHLGHGLPFAYNADEAEHFVPKAVGMFRGSLDPGYYENPPGLTYLLYAIFRLRFGFGRGLVREFAADPEAAYLTARVAVALIGTLVVGLAYWAGARFYERRVGLVAAAIIAVAFLPVFYSKHALNDVVTLAPVTVALVACLLICERGRWVDWALAGGAIGAATATKYTAAAMLVTVALAAALRLLRDRSELRRVLAGCAVAGAAFAAVFLLLDPWAILSFDEVRRQVRGQSLQADTGKLGQDDVLGWIYYVGTLGWALGWAPLAAAVGGAVVALKRTRSSPSAARSTSDGGRALLLVAFPVLLYLYMGAQARFFARWLLPAYPALCVLAGYGVVALADAIARRPRRAGAIVAGLAGLACVQGLLSTIHLDTVLGRTDTREQARRWIDSNVPAGGRLVVEPFVPASWRKALDRPVKRVERPFQAYEKRLRVHHVDRYRRRGYCWVVVGSLQKDRGLKAGLRSSRNYYRALDLASASTVTFSPYARGADPVRFSYDKSFNYQPRAYERPGPVVEIHRLADCTPSIR